MRSFTIPENIQLRDPLTEKPGEFVPFKRWFLETVLNDDRMGATPVKLARVMSLIGKITVTAPGATLEIEDADYDACKAIVEDPHKALGGPVLSGQLLPFAEAFLSATKKD